MGHDSGIVNSHYAVLVLTVFDAIHLIDTASCATYVASLQQPDGSFKGDI